MKFLLAFAMRIKTLCNIAYHLLLGIVTHSGKGKGSKQRVLL